MLDKDNRLAAQSSPGREEMAAALEAGERFLRSCMSAWAAGEPMHRVETMLADAGKFDNAIRALSANDTQPRDERDGEARHD